MKRKLPEDDLNVELKARNQFYRQENFLNSQIKIIKRQVNLTFQEELTRQQKKIKKRTQRF